MACSQLLFLPFQAGRSALLWGAGVAISVPLVAPSVLAEEKVSDQPANMVKVSDMPIYDDTKDLYKYVETQLRLLYSISFVIFMGYCYLFIFRT